MKRRDAALLILIRNDGKILLQHRTDDAPRWPGYWGLFGGGVNKNESHLNAVRREILEELDYRLGDCKLFLVMDVSQQDYKGTRYIFIAKYDKKQGLKLREGQGMEWFSFDDALSLKMSSYNKKAIGLLKEAPDQGFKLV